MYEQNLIIAEDLGDEPSIAKVYDRMADIYNSQEKLEQALAYYERSAEIYEQLQFHETHALILYSMGLIKLKQNDMAAGYRLLKRALEIDRQYGFFNLEAEQEFLDNLELLLDDGKH